MALGEPQRLLELILPVGKQLLGTGIDQVEARAREDRLREAHGADGFVHRVPAAELGERPFAQRLHAQRDAIDAGSAIALEALGLDRGRIGLERDLGLWSDSPVLPDGFKDRCDRARIHQRGRAAAEEDRLYGATL